MRTKIFISNIALLGMALCFLAMPPQAAHANTAPIVTEVSVRQQMDIPGTFDIHYRLSDSDGDLCTISIVVSDDGGSTWNVPVTDLTDDSDIGENIRPGYHHITWNSKTDLPGAYGTNYRVKVIADDGVEVGGDSLMEGLVAYWRFEDGPDDIISGILGTLVDGPVQVPGFGGGQCYEFDNSGYIKCGNAIGDLLGVSDITVSMWVNFDTRKDDGLFVIGTFGASGETPARGQIEIYATDNDIRSLVNADTTTRVFAPLDAGENGVWNHVTVAYDGVTLRIYLNGSLIDSHECNVDIDFSGHECHIGAYYTPNYATDGLIDELAVWGRALSAAEIAEVCEFGVLPESEEPADMVFVSITEEDFNGEMSKYEITNGQYRDYLNSALVDGLVTVYNNEVYASNDTSHSQIYFALYSATVYYSQIEFSDETFAVRTRDEQSMSDHPVVCVGWHGATAFCDYYGYRLPTDVEWEAVADYDGSYIYGCGTSIDSSKANYKLGSYNYSNPLGLSDYPYTSPVGYYEAQVDHGYDICDMAGNVWEWTCTENGSSYFTCGGSWYDSSSHCTVSLRGPNNPQGAHSNIGFRVCR